MTTITRHITSYVDLKDALLSDATLNYPLSAPFYAGLLMRSAMRNAFYSAGLRFKEDRGNFIVSIRNNEEAWIVVRFAERIDRMSANERADETLLIIKKMNRENVVRKLTFRKPYIHPLDGLTHRQISDMFMSV